MKIDNNSVLYLNIRSRSGFLFTPQFASKLILTKWRIVLYIIFELLLVQPDKINKFCGLVYYYIHYINNLSTCLIHCLFYPLKISLQIKPSGF